MKKNLFAAAIACAVLATACGDKGGIRMGSLSKFDSLSYVIGANIGYGIGMEMSDIPFDFSEVNKGIEDAAMGKSSIEHEAALERLREYFMMQRGERAQQIMMARAEQDSIRMAAGDSTEFDYPVADQAMFVDEQERQELSYMFGNDIGFNIKESGLPLFMVWVGEAIKNVQDGTAKMTEDEVNHYLQYFFMVKRPAENAEASTKWLEKMAKKSGAKKTESGLVYKVIEKGDASVMATDDNDVVKVFYTGRTREGKFFDGNVFANMPKDRQDMIKEQNPEYQDEPVEFALNRVIKGWTEGMKLVGKGGKIMLWIPADLAYGQRGAGRDIGPNEALEFEIVLVDVTPYDAPAIEEIEIDVEEE